MTLDEFFAGNEESRELYDAVAAAAGQLDGVEVRVSRSQVAFRRKTGFAQVWIPERYLRRPVAPLVLTIGLRRRDDSPRWKQVVEPAPGRFTHHLEITSAEQVDDEVRGWLREAWEAAG